MPTPEKIKRQIDGIVGYLVEVGLSTDQNYGVRRDLQKRIVEVTFPHARHVSIALKGISYREVYARLASERAFNAKLPDGALIQMMYEFVDGGLRRHRLAFFPSPDLEEFQNNPEIYLEDEIYADIVAKEIVPFPLRFDFDCRPSAYREISHTKAHLTLGQYENCRIPVTSAITPYWFIHFILSNFYHTAFRRYADKLPPPNCAFDECILESEREVVHIQIPSVDGS